MNLQQEFQQQSVIMKILKTHHEQKRSYNLINLNNGDNQKIIILEQAAKKVKKKKHEQKIKQPVINIREQLKSSDKSSSEKPSSENSPEIVLAECIKCNGCG